jgi:hypothetical protein
MTSYSVPLRSGGPAIDEKRVIDRDQCATVTETHSAVVFFAGDRAYKLKKPVNLGFVDFSTPEARAAACQREAEPNRRFAPDVYLGVMEVFDSARMTRVTMLRCTTHPSCEQRSPAGTGSSAPPGFRHSGSRSAAATEPSHHGQHAGRRATTATGETHIAGAAVTMPPEPGVPESMMTDKRGEPVPPSTRFTLLGVGAMNSPRYAPAGLLIEQSQVRVAIDGGPGAEPAGPRPG